MKRLVRAFALVSVLLGLAGCRVDGTVDVVVRADGTGVVAVAVALDDEALARVGDPAVRLRFDDLRAAAWTVESPKKEKDNKTYFRASKSFASAAQFGVVINEVTGPTGVLQAFGFRQSSSFAKTTTEVVGRIDASRGLASFSDTELTEALGGNPLGRPEADVQKDSGNVSLVLRVTVPGAVKGQADRTKGSTAEWTIVPGQAPRDVALQATQVRNGPRLFAALAVGLAVLAVVALVAALTRRTTRRPGPVRAAPLSDAPRGRESLAVAPRDAAPRSEAARGEAPKRRPRVRAVVLDAMGVLFNQGDDVGAHLIPFVAERGGTTDEGLIRERYREASLGRYTTAELWRELDVKGDADELDEAYVSRFELSDGVEDFLDAMARRGVAVACLSNDVSEWAERLRYRFDLADRVEPWVASGDVGARKPDVAIFHALQRALDLPFEACLMVDDLPTNLNAARNLGMSTALVTPVRLGSVDHRQIKSLADLLGRDRHVKAVAPDS